MAKPKTTSKAKKTTEKVIEIPEMDIRPLNLRLVGASPLMCHAWNPKAKEMMLAKQMGKAVPKKPPKDPIADFHGARYRLPDGRDGFKACGVKRAMVDACSFVANLTKVAMKGSVFINDAFGTGGSGSEELLPIATGDGKQWYGTDIEPEAVEHLVRVGSKGPGTGTADLRYRPEYANWSIPIRVTYMANMLTEAQVVQLLMRAGFSIGLGEDRPQLKGGGLGRFTVIGDDPTKHPRIKKRLTNSKAPPIRQAA